MMLALSFLQNRLESGGVFGGFRVEAGSKRELYPTSTRRRCLSLVCLAQIADPLAASGLHDWNLLT
jgi:hypothetical protein